MVNFQESFYDESADYRRGSPHLEHIHVYDKLVAIVVSEIDRLAEAGLPLRVLEVGAGHGGYTEPVLAAGCDVTAIEMSQPSLDHLNKRFGHNRGFAGVYDPDATLKGVGSAYSLVLCVSVLHHIPDYMGTIRELTQKLTAGGTLITLQDPLWYPRADRRVRYLNSVGYCLWRMHQGDIVHSLRNRIRRIGHGYDDLNPADMVEYHVVRQGVNEEEIMADLGARFGDVSLIKYWTNQSVLFQALGERSGFDNTFGVIARGAG